MASVQIWMIQLPTNTEYFVWYYEGIHQSVMWLFVGWMLSMQFLPEAVIFLVGGGLTAMQPTKQPVELIPWRLFLLEKSV